MRGLNLAKSLSIRKSILGFLPFLVLLLASFSGCLLIPAIQGFSDLGVTEGDRSRLLSEQLQEFHEALYWGSAQQALRYVVPESREKLSRDLQRVGKEERIVDSKVDFVTFSPNAFEADVNITVRYYRVPYYVITERLEKQGWLFKVPGGWMLESRELVKNG